MTHHDIRDAIEQIAREELGVDGALPDGDLSAHLDSVQRLTLVVAIEDHFEICFDPEDEQGVRTLADVVGVVAAKLTERPADASA